MKRHINTRNIAIVVSLILLASFLILKTNDSQALIDRNAAESSAHAVNYKYGFQTDRYQFQEFEVQPNQTLTTILGNHGISEKDAYLIAQEAKDTFDVRKIKSGQKYTILSSKEGLKQSKHFIYEEDAKNYVVFDLAEPFKVHTGEKEVTTVRKYVKGTIDSSLWNALSSANADPVLSMLLADVYACKLDFFDLRPDDEFRIVYDEQIIDGDTVYQVDIVAANVIHRNSNHYAFTFKDGDYARHFDEDGENLKTAFLKAPLHYSRISSRFSNNRFHPVLKRYRAHHGIDYAAPTGTPVMSIGDGTIIKKGYQKRGGGRYLTIRHNSIYSTTYMHFSGYAKNTRVGTRVKQGQVIGYVGASGLATGPHLDFRVYKWGAPINPLSMKSPPSKPVSKQNRTSFNAEKEQILAKYAL